MINVRLPIETDSHHFHCQYTAAYTTYNHNLLYVCMYMFTLQKPAVVYILAIAM